MYICICNAIRESELRSAARACHGDAESIYISLGRPPNAVSAWKKRKTS